MKSSRDATRRTVLETLGASAVGGVIIGTGTVAASGHGGDPKPPNHDVYEGDSEYVEVDGEVVGEVAAYATTNPAGKLSSLGVHLDAGVFNAFDEGGGHREEEFAAHLHFPEDIDTHQFTFNGFHYNPEGHAPPGIYGVPHFDFHFYFIEEEVVEGITGGPLPDFLPFIGLADYEVPDEEFLPGYMFEEHRLIVKEMGEHLLDGTAPEFNGGEFTHTNVYGVYDPAIDPEDPDDFEDIDDLDLEDVPVYEGDGTGRLHFVEPMITTDFISNDLGEDMEVDIATPETFPIADDYPTTYVMKPDGEGGVFVSVDDFEEFPGSSE
jgi:hypothetical protein